MDRHDALEERIAHLTRAVEDLSDVVALQAKDIDRLLALIVTRDRGQQKGADGGEDDEAHARRPLNGEGKGFPPFLINR